MGDSENQKGLFCVKIFGFISATESWCEYFQPVLVYYMVKNVSSGLGEACSVFVWFCCENIFFCLLKNTAQEKIKRLHCTEPH